MSGYALLVLSLAAGCSLRLALIPARYVRKRWGNVLGFAADVLLAVAGGAPYALTLFLFNDGRGAYFSALAFVAGIALPSLFLRRLPKKRESAPRPCESEEKQKVPARGSGDRYKA